MLTSQDSKRVNQEIKRSNKNNHQISIREFYFVNISYLEIRNSKEDILDKMEMEQFVNIVNTYSKKKRELVKELNGSKSKFHVQNKFNDHSKLSLDGKEFEIDDALDSDNELELEM